MAIDLFGHCADPIGQAQRRIVFARAQRPDLFDDPLILYDAKKLGPFGAEIAREFGIEASCCFMLSVNDKEQVGPVHEAVDLLYRVFGTERLVMTWAMDSVYPPARSYPPMPLG